MSRAHAAHRFVTFSARAVWGAALFFGAWGAGAGETDQYLTWGVTLTDSSTALNRYLDEEIRNFVAKENARGRAAESVEALTIGLYLHLFEGLYASRVRNWLKTSPEVDRYPSNAYSDWEYQRMSIFRKPAFPFVLPMAQTVRVGEIYLGIDKVGHMFGFGRRYYQRYLRACADGRARDQAVEQVIHWGIQHEMSVVGKLVDGIFSKGDVEANYQGFRLALAFSTGDAPLFYRENGRWCYRGGLDLRDYVTPEMDESYNPNDYASWRGRRVEPIVAAEYGSASPPPRFSTYRSNYQPSLSTTLVDAWLDKRADASRGAPSGGPG